MLRVFIPSRNCAVTRNYGTVSLEYGHLLSARFAIFLFHLFTTPSLFFSSPPLPMSHTAATGYGRIWTIAYPILLSTLIEQLVGMTDAAFLGRVGEIELGACALGGIFFVAIYMLGLGFSIGTQILMGRRNGQGQYAQIGQLFYQSLYFLFVLAVVLFVLTRSFAPWLLHRIIQSPAVAAAVLEYLDIRLFGLFFAFLNALFRGFFVATTHTRTLTWNSLTVVTANVLFNYLFIFGHAGFPAMGIGGAALASALAAAVSSVYYIVYIISRVPVAHYGLHKLPRLHLGQLRSVLSLSIWTMMQNFLSLGTWFLFFLAVEHLGERELAVTNMIRNVSSFTFMTVIALSSTAATLVSNLMGQGRADEVWPMLRRTIRLCTAILLPPIVIMSCMPDVVLGIFTSHAELIAAGRAPLYVMFSSYVFTIPAQILFHAVAGTGNTRAALIFEAVALTIYCVYVGVAIFGLRLSLSWCWFSEFVYHFFALLFAYLYLRSGRWKYIHI